MKLVVLFANILKLAWLSQSAFVDPEYKLVKWQGWGAAMGWDSKAINLLSEDVQAAVHQALFSQEGLHLDIVRYTIGATLPEDIQYGAGCNHCKNEVYKDAINKQFIWSRNSATRKLLLAAKTLGVSTFEAVAYSPPFWMTKSKIATGNPQGDPLHDNFDPIYANTFADYLTEVVKHYHEVYNVTFTSLAPVFRPSSGEFRGGAEGREGCNMEKETIAQVIKSVHAAFQTKNITFCNISAAEENGIDTSLATQKYLVEESNIATLYSQVNIHGHFLTAEDKRIELAKRTESNDHVIWMTEWMHIQSRLPDMIQGLTIAGRIMADIKLRHVSAWIYWQAFEYWHPDSSHLFFVPDTTATIEDIEMCSGYYVLMQFTKFIRKGFVFVHTSDDDSVAAYDEVSKTLVIVARNKESSTLTKSFDLTAFASVDPVVAYRTSPTEPHVPIPPPIVTNMRFTFEYPTASVTTMQFSNAVAYHRSNLIKNWDFEDSNHPNEPWFLIYGTREDNGINGKNTYRGQYSGSVDYNESKLTLMQNVTISVSRTYHLSAYCDTTAANITFLGILVNGIQSPEAVISNERGYQLYGLAVDAQVDDVLSIYLHSEQGNHTAQIDNVTLR